MEYVAHAAERVKEVNRYFYRCPDCLSVMAVDGSPYAQLECACGGQCEKMGRVYRDRLVTETERCLCDDRCQCARGPSCNCKCGGENHGVGLVSRVELRDAGRIPVIHPPDSGAVARGQDWRKRIEQSRETVKAKYPDWDKKRRGEWVSNEGFRQYLDAQKHFAALRKIGEGKVFSQREKKLAAFLGVFVGGSLSETVKVE
jgi:hypothetical protein